MWSNVFKGPNRCWESSVIVMIGVCGGESVVVDVRDGVTRCPSTKVRWDSVC